MSLCGGCVVCLSCYSTLIKILVLFSLVYINSLGVSEHICHRFWRLMILKREKIPLFIMVSLMWFPCAADKGEISRWCKTSLVISRQHYQVYMFFLTAAQSLLKFCNLSLDLVEFFLIICFFRYFLFDDRNMSILTLTNPKFTSQTESTSQTPEAVQRRKEKTLHLCEVMSSVCLTRVM